MRLPFLLFTLLIITAGGVFAESRSEKLGDRLLKLEEIFYDGFDKGLENWSIEGDAAVGVKEGWLEVDAREGKVAAATIWCRREFAGPQVVEYDVRLLGNSIQSNVNMFLLASIPAGPGILETGGERDGSYNQYHRFPNYLVTILNGVSPEKREMLRVRLRLDPGFKLASESWSEPLVFGKVYHVAYLIEPPELTVYLDGREAGKAVYETKLERGLHGLRIWHTHSIYDNFRVSRVVE